MVRRLKGKILAQGSFRTESRNSWSISSLVICHPPYLKRRKFLSLGQPRLGFHLPTRRYPIAIAYRPASKMSAVSLDQKQTTRSHCRLQIMVKKIAICFQFSDF